MKTFLITKEHLSENNEYIGADLSYFDGNIEAEKNLGTVKIKSLSAKGYIYFNEGSGISAGDGTR